MIYKKAPSAYTVYDLIMMTRSGIPCIKIDKRISYEELNKALYGNDIVGTGKEIFRYELVVVDDKMYLEHI